MPERPAERAPAARVVRPPLQIALTPPTPRGAFRWEAEVAGAVTLLVEAGLSELDGVLVTTADRPWSPGATQAVGLAGSERWTARLTLGEDPAALEVELELCPPVGDCSSTSGTGSRDTPEGAVPALVDFVSAAIARQPAAGAAGQWGLPMSADPYAVLMAGRAAATWYGLLPAPPPEVLGDVKRDAIARAVYIDPSMALPQWLLGRRAALAHEWGDARQAFTAARSGRPFHPVLLADEAFALGEEPRPVAAADAWGALAEAVPDDPRFTLPRALSELRAGRLEVAGPLLGLLSTDWPRDPAVAAARVALADAAGEEKDLDELLARWQDNDPRAAEPVRRRIQVRIRRATYREAWDFLPELRRRGATDQADRLEMPLGVAIGEWQAAAEAAERTGQPEVAARIRARAALEADPSVGVAGLDADPAPEALIVRAAAALRAGRTDEAIGLAERAERARPWDVDALTVLRDAQQAAGRADEAARTGARLEAIEPPSPPVMVVAVGAR